MSSGRVRGDGVESSLFSKRMSYSYTFINSCNRIFGSGIDPISLLIILVLLLLLLLLSLLLLELLAVLVLDGATFFQKGSVVSNWIGMKVGRIVLQVITYRLTVGFLIRLHTFKNSDHDVRPPLPAAYTTASTGCR